MSDYGKELLDILEEYQRQVKLQAGDLFVVGCSTSEVIGNRIGTTSSEETANKLMPVFKKWTNDNDLHLAVQGCEHINRSLVVSEQTADVFDLDIVSVMPHKDAGGALTAAAMKEMEQAVVVESLLAKASGGLDIGDTFIGMHIKAVAVPIRISTDTLGDAHISLVSRRPKLIGGVRAKYK